jgi:hypothetical protein
VDALDIDLDGDVDLVVANHETSNITVLLKDGLARFEQATYSPVERYVWSMVVRLALWSLLR